MVIKTKKITISIAPGTISYILTRFRGKENYEFSQLADIRHILSNEKAKILYTVKHSKPASLYHLAKMLKRDFKSVREDIKTLEKVGLIKLDKQLKGKRKSLKPVSLIDSLQISFNI